MTASTTVWTCEKPSLVSSLSTLMFPCPAWVSSPSLSTPSKRSLSTVSLHSHRFKFITKRWALPRPSRVGIRACASVPATKGPSNNELEPPNAPEEDPRGIRTTPFYIALVAAQMLPFINATGILADLAYFTITALSCIVIGVRRAPLEPPVLTAALSPKQALAAPFTASIFLFGSYLLLKYTSVDISFILNVLTTITGTLCVKETLDPVFHTLLSSVSLNRTVVVRGASPDNNDDDNKARPPVYVSDVMSTVAAVATTAAYFFKVEPTFVFSNVIAVSLATRVLSLIRPSSFLVGAGLLTGLFFYDIFWVFGSEVMVSVATQIDTPGKLLFPRDLSQMASSSVKYPYAILGLGDVCIPGLFISLAQSMDQRFAPDLPKQAQPYFVAAVSAYTLGLGLCFLVNYVTNAAQPALLYLVPALIGSSIAVAAWRGELGDVLAFSESKTSVNDTLEGSDGTSDSITP